VVRVKNALTRDKLVRFLKKNGIGVNFHYPAIYGQPYYQQHGYSKIKLINTEIYQAGCLTLPCYPNLTHSQVKHICQLIKDFCDGKNIYE
jgi:dTDP-4-amino-4,6-dideoxygalactose transaminase